MFKKKFVRPPTSLVRSSNLSDLTYVCQDGLVFAHQFVLGRHSPFLKKLFAMQSTLVGVTLNQPRLKGLPHTLKERREPSHMVHIHLPDYTILTVNLLLDLLYIGKTDQCGEIDQSMGQLSIRLLYEDLGIKEEGGGLPDIAELDTVEVEHVKEVQVVVQQSEKENNEFTRMALPAIEAATSTTVEIEVDHPVIETVDLVNDNTMDDEEVVNLPDVNDTETIEDNLEGGSINQDKLQFDEKVIANSPNELEKVSELLGGYDDDDDLLSEEEIELDDDSETFEVGGDEVDTSFSPDIDGLQSMKQFSKIEEDGIAEQERDFIDEVNKDFSDIDDELSSSFDLDKMIETSDDQIVEEERRSSPSLIKKIKLEKNEANVEAVDTSTQKNKIELKLSVHGEKKRKRKGSCEEEKRKRKDIDDTDYTPSSKGMKEAGVVKTFGSRVTRSCSKDMEEKNSVSGTAGVAQSDSDRTMLDTIATNSSDEVASVESYSDFEKKLSKVQAYQSCSEFVPPDLPESMIAIIHASSKVKSANLELCESKPDSSKRTSLTPILSFKATKKLPRSIKPTNRFKKSQKIKATKNKISKSNVKFSCPIQGCAHRQSTSLIESTHPRIYHILKHLICYHLRKEPCTIYSSSYVEPTMAMGRFKCTKCTYKSESKTSLYTHMACDHRDLYYRIRNYREKVTNREELDIYKKVEEFLKGIWVDWKPKEIPETVDCSVNLTVKSCYPCDEIFLSWPDLKNHILVHHCKDKLDVYISGSEVAGYECEASHECNVKFKDRVSILNHLSSKDHLIIEEKEIMDIALGIKSKDTNKSKPDHSSYEEAIPLKPSSSIHQDSTDNVIGCEGLKMVHKRQNAEIKKRKDKISILNHLSTKDHLIIGENEIVDIALGIKSKDTNISKPVHSSYEEVILLKSTSSIHQDSTENVKDCNGPKIVHKRPNAEEVKKRKNRESFEIFGSPLQIIKEPSPAKERKIYSPPKVANSRSKPAEIPIPKSTPMEASLILEILPVKNQQCKLCAYDYISDNDLRDHLLEKHAGNFKTVPMLEAGEKYYECQHCTKKTKVRQFHIQHLKKLHKIITLDLIKSEELWKQGIIGYVDFCIERDDSMDFMLQPRAWESKPEESETSSHGKFHSRSDKSPVRSPDSKNYVPVPNNPIDSPELELISDNSFNSEDCVETDIPDKNMIKAFSPKTNIKDDDDSSDDEIIEEYVSITKRKPPKVKGRSRSNSELACKVCDMLFPSGAKVSAHVFMFHLQRMSDAVWHELYTQDSTSKTKVCSLCGDQQDRGRLAKLHQYSEHKRDLKKKMEEKGQDWRNLLDYIQYKVSEEMINEEEVSESEVESRNDVYDNPFYLDQGPPVSLVGQGQHSAVVNLGIAAVTQKVKANKCGESDSDDGVKVCMERRDVPIKKFEVNIDSVKEQEPMEDKTVEDRKEDLCQVCPFSNCNEIFEHMSSLVDHYLLCHSQSPMKLALVKVLAPERFGLNSSQKKTIKLLGELKEVSSCPQCQVQFVELQLQVRHVARHSDPAAVQCDHCRNFVKVGEKEQHQNACLHKGEWTRIQEIEKRQKNCVLKPSTSTGAEIETIEKEEIIVQVPGKVYPCTHRQVGCDETFTEKGELHSHARKCKHRPNTSFACKHDGCSKRYYYKDDYEKHLARTHPPPSGNVPTTSNTSSTSVVCTPTLHTCHECTAAFPSQQNLSEHILTAHQ
eukprot:GFUD01000677.1.p1 GENE.GFUD01000677.1~~GFUD01000677.1.p1  ORF type:complete len:1703 (-),score=454.85 GFUD01000677.1:96-5204(-)